MDEQVTTPDVSAEESQLAALGSIVDYAIIEGAQLNLPTFVFLLRVARTALIEASADPRFGVVQWPESRGTSRGPRNARKRLGKDGLKIHRISRGVNP